MSPVLGMSKPKANKCKNIWLIKKGTLSTTELNRSVCDRCAFIDEKIELLLKVMTKLVSPGHPTGRLGARMV